MKRQPPARARRAAMHEAAPVSESRTFEPEKPKTSRYFRGVRIEDWERLELAMEQRRCLEHLRTCRKHGCPFCDGHAPRMVHSMFFATKYDPLAA